MAVIIPRGAEKRVDKTVTATEATKRGNIPKDGGADVGYHSCPKRKAVSDTFLSIGIPSTKRKTRIAARIRSEIRATTKRTKRMA
jgi:hypothetical protein